MSVGDPDGPGDPAHPGTSSEQPIRLGIVGTGGIGRLHARLGAELASIDLVAVSSLDIDAQDIANEVDAQLFPDYRDMVEAKLDAVIVATPNVLHLEVSRFFAEAGVHLLVEKPIADTHAAGRVICETAERCGVHLMVGHHRRHQNLVRAAREFVTTRIGTLLATNTLVTMRKPDSYYEVEWRRSEGAGPLLVNLIHEVDLLRAVCGEITHVQAAAGTIGRNYAFDDTASMILHFANGAFGTLVISESTPSPWSWEASVSDGMGFFNAGQDHSHFVGTAASLSFPSLTAWSYDPSEVDPGWESQLHAARIDIGRNNPYVDQLDHLANVVRGNEEPIVSGWDALQSLAVVDAVIQATRNGSAVAVAT